MNALIRDEARRVMAEHARTFSAAAWFLPPASRDEVAVLYALCRRIDDAADEQADRAALDDLEAQIRGQREAEPLVAAFLAIADRRSVPIDAVLHLIEGARSDLGVVRVADEAELIRYSYLVAGAVGRLICPVLGAVDPIAVPFAMDLGIGMQLSNIARDVTEDACRGRVYLPASWLAEEGVEPNAIVAGTAEEERVVRVVARTVALAEAYYASARFGFRFLPLRPRTAVVLAAHRYRAIGRTVAARGVDALRSRTVVSRSAAAAFAVSAPVASLFAAVAPGRAHDRRLHRPLAGLLPQVAA